jgi:hypothetical protein
MLLSGSDNGLSSVRLSNMREVKSRTAQLTLKDIMVSACINLRTHASSETHLFRAGSDEFVTVDPDEGCPHINAENFAHSRTYDIKDLAQNVVCITQKGGVSNYSNT